MTLSHMGIFLMSWLLMMRLQQNGIRPSQGREQIATDLKEVDISLESDVVFIV